MQKTIEILLILDHDVHNKETYFKVSLFLLRKELTMRNSNYFPLKLLIGGIVTVFNAAAHNLEFRDFTPDEVRLMYNDSYECQLERKGIKNLEIDDQKQKAERLNRKKRLAELKDEYSQFMDAKHQEIEANQKRKFGLTQQSIIDANQIKVMYESYFYTKSARQKAMIGMLDNAVGQNYSDNDPARSRCITLTTSEISDLSDLLSDEMAEQVDVKGYTKYENLPLMDEKLSYSSAKFDEMWSNSPMVYNSDLFSDPYTQYGFKSPLEPVINFIKPDENLLNGVTQKSGVKKTLSFVIAGDAKTDTPLELISIERNATTGEIKLRIQIDEVGSPRISHSGKTYKLGRSTSSGGHATPVKSPIPTLMACSLHTSTSFIA
jgi:hypothetical protein